jgi:hypothetical protein
MFGRWIEAERHGRFELGDQFVEDPVFGFQAFAAPEPPFGAMPDVQPIATFDAVRPVLDEPKGIGSASAFRAAELHDPPFLNFVCAKPISFRLSPNWMIVCGASSGITPLARRRGIFTHRNSSRKRRTSASARRLGMVPNLPGARAKRKAGAVQRAAARASS